MAKTAKIKKTVKSKNKTTHSSKKTSHFPKLSSAYGRIINSPLKAAVFSLVIGAIGTYILIISHAAAPTPPPAGGYFSLTPAGNWQSLPTDAQCAAQVHHSLWEPRSANNAANQTVPTNVQLRTWPYGSTSSEYNTWMLPRVTGNFRGTTDEIIQWASCKWGWPDDAVRAQMVIESYWYQNLLDSQGRTIYGSGFGDYTTDGTKCPAGYSPTTQYNSGGNILSGCPQSFGVLQSRWMDGNGPFGNFPATRDSTAFDIDFTIGTLRACYEGMETWLKQSGPGVYAAGDMWGCIGRWYSGDWHSAAADGYIAKVQQELNNKVWLSWADQSSSITDTSAPSAPSNPAVVAQSSTQINLSWTAAADNVGVTGYDIYRNNVKIATTAATTYSDSGLSPSTSYSYYLVARDAAGNISAASATATVITPAAPAPADTLAPVVKIISPANGATLGRTTNISASATDNTKVIKMQIYTDGTLRTTTTAGSISYSWATRRIATGDHTITVKAYDAAGNIGQSSIIVKK
jgi:chitodextrinase